MLTFSNYRRWVALAARSFGRLATAEAYAPNSLATAPLEPLAPGAATHFQSFDRAFYRNQLFLLGEAHGVAQPQEVEVELLRHLNQRTGVRYYLAEVDAAKAYSLSDYLHTGQTPEFRKWLDR